MNGVVRTLSNVIAILEDKGLSVKVISPESFLTIACPLYPEIRLAVSPYRKVARVIEREAPDFLHVVTEGPIGLAARRYAVTRRMPFTTSFHTHFAKYLRHLACVPESVSWRYLRWFHGAAVRTMVATESAARELRENQIDRVSLWSRGIDQGVFRTHLRGSYKWPRPIAMYVGRVSKEKNIDAFLQVELPVGSKVVVGDGPYRAQLEKRFPDTIFTGYKSGDDLAEAFSNADVFVFPSKTETFGNVVLEALACGTPVAAYPSTGPLDILTDPRFGCCDDNLAVAVAQALRQGNREACSEYARSFTWTRSADQFLSSLVSTSIPRTPPTEADGCTVPL